MNSNAREIILREENEFPKLFTSFAERDYGILYYNTDEKDSYDSNHSIILPNKITDLGAVLEDIKHFYAELGYKETSIYHPFVPKYFTNNLFIFEKHGFSVHIEESRRMMILIEENMLARYNRLRIERLSEWDERILTDILAPDGKNYEQSVLKNSLRHPNFYLFVGYISDKAVVEVNFHVSQHGCTRFDHIVTAPDERGKGYAREIMCYVSNFCRENRFPLCYQWPDNGTSERITTQAGFRYMFDIESGYAVCKV